MMRAEHIEGTLVLRAGIGEWYNREDLGMCGDVDLPPALWHAEVDAALPFNKPHPSLVVIDATEMTYLYIPDLGFLRELAKRLKPSGTKLIIVARSNAVRAFALLRSNNQMYFDVVGTLDEALRGQ